MSSPSTSTGSGKPVALPSDWNLVPFTLFHCCPQFKPPSSLTSIFTFPFSTAPTVCPHRTQREPSLGQIMTLSCWDPSMASSLTKSLQVPTRFWSAGFSAHCCLTVPGAFQAGSYLRAFVLAALSVTCPSPPPLHHLPLLDFLCSTPRCYLHYIMICGSVGVLAPLPIT